jgi:hypothetical protein
MNPATVSQQGPSVFAAEVTIKAAGLRALCAVWPHDPGVSGTVRSTVPVVFLNGTADPGDPPASEPIPFLRPEAARPSAHLACPSACGA